MRIDEIVVEIQEADPAMSFDLVQLEWLVATERRFPGMSDDLRALDGILIRGDFAGNCEAFDAENGWQFGTIGPSCRFEAYDTYRSLIPSRSGLWATVKVNHACLLASSGAALFGRNRTK